MSGEKTREGHVTVALDVHSKLNLCIDSVCKNCDMKHYALSHYNAGLCREQYSWTGGFGVCRVAEMHVSRLRKGQGLDGGLVWGIFGKRAMRLRMSGLLEEVGSFDAWACVFE